MTENEEKRMAGDYEIIHALHIGDREIVLGENTIDAGMEKYMCAFCVSNGMFASYTEVMVSDDYAEIVQLYGERVAEQAEKTRAELEISDIDNAPITALECTPITHDSDLNGKIIVIKPEILRREYRRATNQLQLCTGGFGTYPNSRGSACFCTELYSGKKSRYERYDVLGTIEPGKLPEWAKLGLERIKQAEKQKKAKDRNER